MSKEKLTVIGNIGDVQLLMSKTTQQPYLRLRVAADWFSKGERRTTWYTALLFGEMLVSNPEQVARYTKGKMVYVEGRPRSEAKVLPDGTARVETTILMRDWPDLLSGSPE